MLMNLKRPSPVLVIMCNMSVPICNRFHTKQANSEKNNVFLGEPLFDSLVREDPFSQEHEILSQKTRVLGQATVKIS